MSWRGTLRHFMPYVIAIAGGFLLAYLVVAFIVFPAGVIPADLRVPNVVGLSYEDAARRLDQAGFGAEQGEVRYNAAAPKGTVLAQNPTSGSKELAGIKVTLAISNGQQLATVPSVVGLARDQGESAIESAGFSLGEVSQRPSEQPLGQIIESMPPAGTKTPVPSAIALVLSAGPAQVVVPDVVGRGFGDARQLFQQLGLGIGDVATDDGMVPADTAKVTGQTPAAGAQVPRGARINLHVGGAGVVR